MACGDVGCGGGSGVIGSVFVAMLAVAEQPAPLVLTMQAATTAVAESTPPVLIANPPPPPPLIPLIDVPPPGAVVADGTGADPAAGPDIVIHAKQGWETPDPLSNLNAKSFVVTDKVDKAVIGPVARGYKRGVPSTIRDGIHNFLYNLREPIVFFNYLFQHKIGKAVETLARFGINSTAGVAGVFDIAKRKPFHLPRRSNGFSNTLAFYGVPNGAFLYLPLVGPTTVRDILGGAIDRLALPLTLGQGVTDLRFAIPVSVLSALDHRSEFDDTYKALDKAPGDKYAIQRDFYLQRRQNEIDALHGRSKGDVGGMNEPPKGSFRLKQRNGAPPVIIPIGPGADTAPKATAPAPTGAAPAETTPAPVTGTPPAPANDTAPAPVPGPAPAPTAGSGDSPPSSLSAAP